MSDNLYQPPRAQVADIEPGNAGAPAAGKGRRFANFVLDTIFYYLFAIVIGAALGLLGFADQLEEMNKGAELLLGWGIFLVYYLSQETLWGWTFAKLITGTRVVNEDGERASFRKILGRSFARLVPFEPFSFFGGQPGGWHDRWSGTRVIYVRGSHASA